VIFLLPRIQSAESLAIGQIVAVILFMIGPLSNVVISLPFLAKADAALVSLEMLENELDAANDTKYTMPQSQSRPNRPFEEIRLEQVVFNHTDGKGQAVFTLGPIDLTIHPGEILFIGGGNGSGKSTLLKLITGLYYPTSGQITVDSVPADMGNYVHYRNLFSIIFANFHLFDRLYGLEDIEEERVYHLLEIMRLSEKTLYVDGRFTNLSLSTGQRKRLAMIASRLEEKQIFVFDEVAADQDPVFRKYFYDVYLKELKAEGRTIIAATHDDPYFHVADRVLKMEEGKVVNSPMIEGAQ
jgi:putative ATP-binding cassette transporter